MPERRIDRQTVEFSIHPDLERIGAARHFVRRAVDSLAGGDCTEVAEDAELLASEAISNAVVHARTDVIVTVRRQPESFLVSVHDHDPTPLPPPTRPDPDSLQPGGRGLLIIDALAEDWGVDQVHDDGKVVWFTLGFDQHHGGTKGTT
jgi:anti-sigma regulatory factor (Ser/Thr protein kinase)